ncbi:MAG: peptidase [Spirochaetaceae bacterium]|nr:peptidase [Spirochaetaceae bacterium]
MATEEIASIIKDLEKYDSVFTELRETFLANVVMLSEIPATTFEEQERVNFLINRFSDSELINTSTDEYGNALGLIPGSDENKNIVLTASIDSSVDTRLDHSVSVSSQKITGVAVGDNTIGLAALTMLQNILDKLEIKLKSNLILVGASQSLGNGNLGGLKFFLSNVKQPIKAGICIEGKNLGDFSHRSMGMMKCEVIYNAQNIHKKPPTGRFGAIETLSEIISRMREIPIPNKPSTSICFSSIESGSKYDTEPSDDGILRFELRSESVEMVQTLKYEIQDLVSEISANYGVDVKMNVVAQTKQGGIPFTHPIAANTREIMEAMNIKYSVVPSTSALSAFVDNNIPAITVALTNEAEKERNLTEAEIEPLSDGLKLLLALILSIDRGEFDGP